MLVKQSPLDEVLAADAILSRRAETPVYVSAADTSAAAGNQLWSELYEGITACAGDQVSGHGLTLGNIVVVGTGANFGSGSHMSNQMAIYPLTTNTIVTATGGRTVTDTITCITVLDPLNSQNVSRSPRYLLVPEQHLARSRCLGFWNPLDLDHHLSALQLYEPSKRSIRGGFLSLLAERRAFITEQQYVNLAKQLQLLFSDEDELEGLGIKPSIASFRGLTRFLSNSNNVHPSISLSKAGLFVASWSPSRSEKLTLTFEDWERGTWVAVKLDHPTSRGSGDFNLENFSLPEPYSGWK